MMARLAYLLLDLGRFLALRGIRNTLLDKFEGITSSPGTARRIILGVELTDGV